MSESQRTTPFGDFIIKNVAKNVVASRTLELQLKWNALARVLGEPNANGDKLKIQVNAIQETDLMSYVANREAAKIKSGIQRFKSFESQSSFVEDFNNVTGSKESNAEVHWWEIQQSELDLVESRMEQKDPGKTSKVKEVTICVLDEARKKKDTFLCPQELLLREMPYFQKFLESDDDCEVQFSVHCDVEVFKRLLLFASKDDADRETYAIEPKYAIHMLVSADFLQMKPLVEKCLDFCHKNMNLLLSLSGIIGLLSESLLLRLASLFTPEEIPNLDDPNDKIKSKLFRKLSEELLNSPNLKRCTLCEKVFTTETQNHVACLSNRTTISKKGEIHYNHKIDQNWTRSNYLQAAQTEFGGWQKVYWIMWGSVHSLPCGTCQKVFSCKEYSLCRYHSESAKFPEVQTEQSSQDQHVTGQFLCCGQKVSKFNLLDPLQMNTGCSYRNHMVPQQLRQSEIFKTLMANKGYICLAIPVTSRSDENLIDFKTLCKWSDDIISRPHFKSGHSRPTLAMQKLRLDDKERNLQLKLLPGRADSQTDRNQQLDRLSWNPSSSIWHNQDSIREYDYVGMEAIISSLKQH